MFQLVVASHIVDVIIGSCDVESIVVANELHTTIGKGNGLWRCCGDVHASEDRIHDVGTAVVLPLDEIRYTSLQRFHSITEYQCGVGFLHAGVGQRLGCGTSQRTVGNGDIEGQTDGVPQTVLVECTSVQSHIEIARYALFSNGRNVVGTVIGKT